MTKKIALISMGLLFSLLVGCESSQLETETTEKYSEDNTSQVQEDGVVASPSANNVTRQTSNSSRVRPEVIDAYRSQGISTDNTCDHIQDPYRLSHCQSAAVSQRKQLSLQNFWNSLYPREQELIRSTENFWRQWYMQTGQYMSLNQNNVATLAQAVGVKNDNELQFILKVLEGRAQQDQGADDLMKEICSYGVRNISEIACSQVPGGNVQN